MTAQRIAAAHKTRDREAGRRHVITVNRPFDEIGAGGLPGPLAALGDAVEVDRHPAPDGPR